MTLSRRSHTAAAFLFVIAASLIATAQAPALNTTEWENEALKLRLFYPSDLVKADPEQVMQGGQVNLFGVSDAKLAAATHCLRPLLFLKAPSTDSTAPAAATQVLLAELNVECLNAEHESGSTTLLNDMAEIVNKVPGMKSISQPSTYTIGWQKVHMAAAQGQPAGAAQLYTMGISTNWNSHLLVWYFSSDSIDTLNRITKTTVRFGRDQAAPLYPLAIGNADKQ
jgi:hypothetical protein